jgi:hypothetical protein
MQGVGEYWLFYRIAMSLVMVVKQWGLGLMLAYKQD